MYLGKPGDKPHLVQTDHKQMINHSLCLCSGHVQLSFSVCHITGLHAKGYCTAVINKSLKSYTPSKQCTIHVNIVHVFKGLTCVSTVECN